MPFVVHEEEIKAKVMSESFDCKIQRLKDQMY